MPERAGAASRTGWITITPSLWSVALTIEMPNRSRNALASAGDDSGAERELRPGGRGHSADGGVASTYDSARPTVLKYVAS